MLAYHYTSEYFDGGGVTMTVPEDELRSVSTSLPMTEEQDDGFATTDEPLLLNNVLVYALAEKYGTAKLKEIAKAKFQDRVGSLLSAREFPEIVRELFRSMPLTDRGLRHILSQICAQRGRRIVNRWLSHANPNMKKIRFCSGRWAELLYRQLEWKFSKPPFLFLEQSSESYSYVLVTGATGFIGAHIVDALLARWLNVRGATHSAEKAKATLEA